jgi:hypothetical protein
VNKEQFYTPAPNNYGPRKNDKVANAQIRKRDRVVVREAKSKAHQPRRAKDREEDDNRNLRGQTIIPPSLTEQVNNGSPAISNNQQDVYTLGMEERDKRLKSDDPGPGTHSIKSRIGEGPAFKMGSTDKDYKADRDQTAGPSSFNIVLKSRAPKYSFGSRSGITLGFGKNGQQKSMRPGPGAYDQKDQQFKKPCTKFSKAGRDSLAKSNGPGPGKDFNPQPILAESDHYSFPLARRDDDQARARNARRPGPGEYEVLSQLPKGQSKSILGGALNPPQLTDNGVPGPGNYDADIGNEYLNHIPGVKIVNQPDRFKRQEMEDKVVPVDDGNLKKNKSKGISIGKGLREPISNKFHTPAPTAYDVVDYPSKDKKGDEKKYKFHMGMRTEYKANRGQDMPGPAEYYPGLYERPNQSHIIGTGHRSDLGVGKAYLAPGPGEYEVRGKIEGPQIKFGNEVKNTKIKKTYEPGPANYDLPSTVGNIPKYLRLRDENEENNKLDDRSDNIALL